MKEEILLVPGINETELLRSLAKYGVNTFGLRIMSTSELAKLALSRSGECYDYQEIFNFEMPCIINSFIKEVDYFKSSSFKDAENLAKTLNSIRKHVISDEKETLLKKLNNGEFVNKNRAILEIYNKYMFYCENKKLIDSVSVIRKALNCKPIDANFSYLKELPLEPLDKKLLEVLSNNNYQEKSITTLFGVNNKKIKIERYAKCYGSSNELEEILHYIYKNNIPLDEVSLALVNPNEYSGLLVSYSKQYNIPITLETGILISQTNPAKLLRLYLIWDNKGHHGIDALHDMIFSESFNRHHLFEDLGLKDNDYNSLNKIIELAGSLRIDSEKVFNHEKIIKYKEVIEGNDEDVVKNYDKDIIKYVEILASIFEKQIENFINRYAANRKGILSKIDVTAKNTIYSEIVTYKKHNSDRLEELLKHILDGNVGMEVSKEGAIHACSLKSILSTPRKYLFILGLSANNFPGSPKENYLLLDSDCALFDDASDLTSFENVNKNKRMLNDVIQLASSLGSKIYLSYSCHDLSELKDLNASSSLFDIYKSEHEDASTSDFEKNLYLVPFFKYSLSNLKYIGEAYNNEEELIASNNKKEDSYVSASLSDTYSPSRIEDFFNCPRKFYLKTILKIKEPDDNKEDQIIKSNDFGSLAHAMMEHLAKDHLDEETFIKLASDKFDEYIKRRIPYSKANVRRQKEEFISTLKTSYHEDPNNKLVAAEQEQVVVHKETGINLKGIPDRVEQDENNRYLIVDFKTGRKVKHKENDVDTCLQVLIYAYIMEKLGYNISKGIYKYLRQGTSVECDYSQNSKDALANKLQGFKDVLISGKFITTTKEENCRYCKYNDICDKEKFNAKEED